MANFTLYTQETAPNAATPLLDGSVKDFGMIPNLHALFAASPEALEAYKVLHTLFQKTSLTAAEQTVVWQTINVEHECHYCVPAHTMIANMMNIDPAITEALRNETPLPEPRLESLRTFTLAVLRDRGAVSDATVQAFYDAGFTQQNVMEVLLGLAQKVMSNYVNHMADTPTDGAFSQYAWEKKAPVAAQ